MRIGPLGAPEIIIILILVLLIFGARRLPEMARGIGQSVREFRKGIRDMKDDFEHDDEADKRKANSVSTLEAESLEAERLKLREEQARLRAEQEAFRAEKERQSA